MDGKARKTEDSTDLIPLGKAAKAAPGRPSTNAIWRWCRRGVASRSGERVKLEHVRVGGRIFTSVEWVRDFGRRLADADAKHFQPQSTIAHAAPSKSDIEAELEKAGL